MQIHTDIITNIKNNSQLLSQFFIALVDEATPQDKRITELENKAKDKCIECIGWKHAIKMLSVNEQKEYNKLIRKTKKEKR